jgi:hypothetical protein
VKLLQITDIDQDFLSELQMLIEKIFAPGMMIEKRVAGKEVTGKELMKHARFYVETFNSGVLPEAKTMFDVS